MSLEYDITEIKRKLFEMPWVSVGDHVVDLELERYSQSKASVVAHIRDVMAQNNIDDPTEFIDELFSEFPGVMARFNVREEDLI